MMRIRSRHGVCSILPQWLTKRTKRLPVYSGRIRNTFKPCSASLCLLSSFRLKRLQVKILFPVSKFCTSTRTSQVETITVNPVLDWSVSVPFRSNPIALFPKAHLKGLPCACWHFFLIPFSTPFSFAFFACSVFALPHYIPWGLMAVVIQMSAAPVRSLTL